MRSKIHFHKAIMRFKSGIIFFLFLLVFIKRVARNLGNVDGKPLLFKGKMCECEKNYAEENHR